jgi:hypothetical protein
VSCEDTSLFIDNAVDLYGEIMETDLMIQLEKSAISAFDTFNIRVTSNRYSVDLDADSAKITLRRSDVQLIDDTLMIVVRNKNSTIQPVYGQVVVKYKVPERNVTFNTTALNMINGIANMPILLRLDSRNVGFEKKCGFRFLKNNRIDTLKYQLTTWNVQAKTAEIWVLFDTITAGGNNDCIMQYGYQLPDLSDGKAVFDTVNNFRCVYHFEEKGLSVTDATAEANNGTFISLNYDKIANAVSGSGILMQETKKNKLVPLKTIQFSPSDEKTLVFESWLKGFQGSTINRSLFSVKVDTSLQYCLLNENGCVKSYYEFKDSLGLLTMDKSNNNVPLSSSEPWDRISFVVNLIENKLVCEIHSNGVLMSKDTLLPPENTLWEKSTFIIGAKFEGGFANGYFDEVWVSKGKRSEGWIKFAYENQKQASTLIKIQD